MAARIQARIGDADQLDARDAAIFGSVMPAKGADADNAGLENARGGR
jgi:hypothetical protein